MFQVQPIVGPFRLQRTCTGSSRVPSLIWTHPSHIDGHVPVGPEQIVLETAACRVFPKDVERCADLELRFRADIIDFLQACLYAAPNRWPDNGRGRVSNP